MKRSTLFQQPAPDLSATLVPIREKNARIEVYLLRRGTASPHLPGTYVFPGGMVATADRDVAFWLQHVDRPAARLPAYLGGPVDERLPLAIAAMRETYEETSWLLAEPMLERRSAASTEKPPNGFVHRISAGAMRLSISRLAFLSRWITPQALQRRFDACYFMAAAEPDAALRPDGLETDLGVWLTPETALRENRAGRLPTSPPVVVTLHGLLDAATIDALLRRLRGQPAGAPLMPRWVPLKRGALVVEPWDPEYDAATIASDEKRIQKAVLPVGAPFSRLWVYQGRCHPVA